MAERFLITIFVMFRILCAITLSCVAGAAALDVAAIDRERILKAAGAALESKPITITAFRAKWSEGGLNDFYPSGDYWWPVPSKPDGQPYLRRDGESNPGNFTAHRDCMNRLRDVVAALGVAYRVTGKDRYAGKAAELLRVFFLDGETRLRPHLLFAQAIPGVSSGCGIGIIDTLHLIEIPPVFDAMAKSSAFPEEVLAGMKGWFGDYTRWMLTSKNGIEEAETKNNHAVAYWLQMACFARFTGDIEWLAECRRRFKEVFIPKQMAEDGVSPLELARTNPYGYSIFHIDDMATLCHVLSMPGDDLWKSAPTMAMTSSSSNAATSPPSSPRKAKPKPPPFPRTSIAATTFI